MEILLYYYYQSHNIDPGLISRVWNSIYRFGCGCHFLWLGKEIRSILDAKVAQLYFDLDAGFTALAWLLPSWVPLPSFQWVYRFLAQLAELIVKTSQKPSVCLCLYVC